MDELDAVVVNVNILDPERDWNTIYTIYNRLVDCGDMARLYWETPGIAEIAFQDYLSFYKSAERYLCLITGTSDRIQHETVGVGLINSMRGDAAFIGFWLEPKWRGHNGPLIGRAFLACLHGQIKFDKLICCTPWRGAQSLAERVGLEHLGTIRDIPIDNQRTRNLKFYRSTRDAMRLYLILENMGKGFSNTESTQMAQRLLGMEDD